YAISPNDPQVTRDVVQKFRLRGGESMTAQVNRGRQGRGQPQVSRIEAIGNMSVADYAKVTPFDELPVVHPEGKLTFETPGGPMSTRIIDLLAPIGKGQRGLIVAPPRTGKTVLLQQMSNGIKVNHPEIFLMMLLIDERPEEVTEMKQTVLKQGAGWQHGAPEV